jgi:hypothetical protein
MAIRIEAIEELIKNVKKLRPEKCMTEFFASNWRHKLYVLDLNRLGQLYYKGIDAKGLLLGHYAKYTLQTKQDPMLSHVTLKETGEFYQSFQLKVHRTFMEITANTKKGNDDLAVEWGEYILGLTEESKEMLSGYMLDNNIKDVVQQKILVDL